MGYIVNKVRTLFWTLFYYLMSRFIFDALGRGCRFQGWIDIPQHSGRIVLGSEVLIGRSVEFSVPRGGYLSIGDRSSLSRGVLINSHESVKIGENVMIASYVCIFDNNHQFDDLNILISDQGYTSKPLTIGSGSWIGAQSVILCGGGMGRNSILGAGAVLNKDMPEDAILGGVPARIIRFRSSEISCKE